MSNIRSVSSIFLNPCSKAFSVRCRKKQRHVYHTRGPFGSHKQVFLGCVSRTSFGQSGVILKWLEGVLWCFYTKNVLEAAICLGGDFWELLNSCSACFVSKLGCAVAPLGTIP